MPSFIRLILLFCCCSLSLPLSTTLLAPSVDAKSTDCKLIDMPNPFLADKKRNKFLDHRTGQSVHIEGYRGIGGKSCGHLVILTEDFVYQHGPSRPEALAEVIRLYEISNKLVFKPTDFSGVDHPDGQGLGNHVQRVMFDEDHGSVFHIKATSWNVNTLRDRLVSQTTYPTNYCLVTVFTSKRIYKHNRTYHGFNPSGTSICQPGKNLIAISSYPCKSLRDADCVINRTLSHEFGHAWGMKGHDKKPVEIKPGEGTNLMGDTGEFVPGYRNQQFSDLSKWSIRNHMSPILRKCFTEPEPKCGNGILDPSEQCDGGPNGTDCCTVCCTLQEMAQCSPDNHLNCTAACQFYVEQVPHEESTTISITQEINWAHLPNYIWQWITVPAWHLVLTFVCLCLAAGSMAAGYFYYYRYRAGLYQVNPGDFLDRHELRPLRARGEPELVHRDEVDGHDNDEDWELLGQGELMRDALNDEHWEFIRNREIIREPLYDEVLNLRIAAQNRALVSGINLRARVRPLNQIRMRIALQVNRQVNRFFVPHEDSDSDNSE